MWHNKAVNRKLIEIRYDWDMSGWQWKMFLEPFDLLCRNCLEQVKTPQCALHVVGENWLAFRISSTTISGVCMIIFQTVLASFEVRPITILSFMMNRWLTAFHAKPRAKLSVPFWSWRNLTGQRIIQGRGLNMGGLHFILGIFSALKYIEIILEHIYLPLSYAFLRSDRWWQGYTNKLRECLFYLHPSKVGISCVTETWCKEWLQTLGVGRCWNRMESRNLFQRSNTLHFETFCVCAVFGCWWNLSPIRRSQSISMSEERFGKSKWRSKWLLLAIKRSSEDLLKCQKTPRQTLRPRELEIRERRGTDENTN